MKSNTQVKRIEYAYPTSITAEYFGMADTGCYFIRYYLYNVEDSYQINSSIHPQSDSEAFLSLDDRDLLSLFLECDGLADVHSCYKSGYPFNLLKEIIENSKSVYFPSYIDEDGDNYYKLYINVDLGNNATREQILTECANNFPDNVREFLECGDYTESDSIKIIAFHNYVSNISGPYAIDCSIDTLASYINVNK